MPPFLVYFKVVSKLTHKLLYSKVYLADQSAALFGVVVGTAAAYMALLVLGSGSLYMWDLSLLIIYTTLLQYTFSTTVSFY